jgi:DNA polymerase III subunit gamma/tau
MSFDTKHRPKTLDRIIGHEKVVTRLKGIIKSKKYPQAVLFVGATSSGKTTLARAFAASVLGVDDPKGHRDFLEINAASFRGIDDNRDLLKISRLKPQSGVRRIIMIDEVQQWTGQAAQLMLKPLEDPPPFTLFLLATMEPEKVLQAIKNRCTQFVLAQQPKENILRFLKRIAKAEGMDYITPELLATVGEYSNGEMRSAAMVLESVEQYVNGLDKPPKKLSADDLQEALSTTEANDDVLAIRVMVALYARKFRVIQLALLDVAEPFRFINTLLRLNSFMLNVTALNGQKHKMVWWSKQNIALVGGVNKVAQIPEGKSMAFYGVVQGELVNLKYRAASFIVPETNLISSVLFDTVNKLKRVSST